MPLSAPSSFVLQAIFLSFAIKLVQAIFHSFYISMLAVDRNHLDDTGENCTPAQSSLACWRLLPVLMPPDAERWPQPLRTLHFLRGSALPSSAVLLLCSINPKRARYGSMGLGAVSLLQTPPTLAFLLNGPFNAFALQSSSSSSYSN